MIPETANKVIRFIRKRREDNPQLKAYALLDGARNDSIYPTLVSVAPRYRCLYTGHELLYWGKMPDVLAAAAPYVVKLDLESEFARWLIKAGWGDCWGMFLLSESSVDELLRHFRRFVMARDNSGRQFYFRFYDPRVFRPYIRTCQKEELDLIFGPVESYIVEGEDADSMMVYDYDGEKLNLRKFSLQQKSVEKKPEESLYNG